MNLLTLEWYHTAPAAAAEGQSAGRAPLVVILPWMFAKQPTLSKYIQLAQQLGWDCCTVSQVPVLALWLPPLAHALAKCVANSIEQELSTNGTRPVVFAVFSGSAKTIYAPLLELLDPPQEETAATSQPNSTSTTGATSQPQPMQQRAQHRLWQHVSKLKTRLTPQQSSTTQQGTGRQQDSRRPDDTQGTMQQQAHTAASSPSQPTPRVQGQAGTQPIQPDEHHPTCHSAGQAGQLWQQFVQLVLQPNTQPRPVQSALQQLHSHSRASRPHSSPSQYPLLSACICGQWFDSSPVDFTSSFGSRMVAPPSSMWLRRALVGVAAGAMDFVGVEAWEGQRQHLWRTLGMTPVATHLPTLICYSWDDPQADPHRIHGFAKLLRLQGCSVVEMAWHTSEHVAHFRHHPQDYTQAVRDLLDKAQAQYTTRHAAALVPGGTLPRADDSLGVSRPSPSKVMSKL